MTEPAEKAALDDDLTNEKEKQEEKKADESLFKESLSKLPEGSISSLPSLPSLCTFNTQTTGGMSGTRHSISSSIQSSVLSSTLGSIRSGSFTSAGYGSSSFSSLSQHLHHRGSILTTSGKNRGAGGLGILLDTSFIMEEGTELVVDNAVQTADQVVSLVPVRTSSERALLDDSVSNFSIESDTLQPAENGGGDDDCLAKTRSASQARLLESARRGTRSMPGSPNRSPKGRIGVCSGVPNAKVRQAASLSPKRPERRPSANNPSPGKIIIDADFAGFQMELPLGKFDDGDDAERNENGHSGAAAAKASDCKDAGPKFPMRRASDVTFKAAVVKPKEYFGVEESQSSRPRRPTRKPSNDEDIDAAPQLPKPALVASRRRCRSMGDVVGAAPTYLADDEKDDDDSRLDFASSIAKPPSLQWRSQSTSDAEPPRRTNPPARRWRGNESNCRQAKSLSPPVRPVRRRSVQVETIGPDAAAALGIKKKQPREKLSLVPKL